MVSQRSSSIDSSPHRVRSGRVVAAARERVHAKAGGVDFARWQPELRGRAEDQAARRRLVPRAGQVGAVAELPRPIDVAQRALGRVDLDHLGVGQVARDRPRPADRHRLRRRIQRRAGDARHRHPRDPIDSGRRGHDRGAPGRQNAADQREVGTARVHRAVERHAGAWATRQFGRIRFRGGRGFRPFEPGQSRQRPLLLRIAPLQVEHGVPGRDGRIGVDVVVALAIDSNPGV